MTRGVDFSDGFRPRPWISAGMCALGGVVSWATIRGLGDAAHA